MSRKGGRPTKLTPEIAAKICDALRGGNFRETAAAFAGVRKSTFHDWIRRGARSSRGLYREFHDACEKALADAELRDNAFIAKAAAGGNWQAAAWRLERRHSERWAKREHHEVDANVKTTVKVSADDAVEEINRLLAARARPGGTDEDS